MKVNQLTVNVVLSILLVLAVCYIGYIKVNQFASNYAVAAYNQGKVDTLVQLYTNTADCKIATVSLGNVTRQVADVECIQKVLSEQNRTR